jgi:hypothetical protein
MGKVVVPAVVRIFTPMPRLAICHLLIISYRLAAPALKQYITTTGQGFTTMPILGQLNFFGTHRHVFYQPAVIQT